MFLNYFTKIFYLAQRVQLYFLSISAVAFHFRRGFLVPWVFSAVGF